MDQDVRRRAKTFSEGSSQWKRNAVSERVLRRTFRQSENPEQFRSLSLRDPDQHSEELTEDEKAFFRKIFPPDELLDDPMTVQLYESAAKHGVVKERTIRVMLVGCFEQGKTTLARRLMGETTHTIKTDDSIDVHLCVCEDIRDPINWRRADDVRKARHTDSYTPSYHVHEFENEIDLSDEVFVEPSGENKNLRDTCMPVSTFSSSETASRRRSTTLPSVGTERKSSEMKKSPVKTTKAFPGRVDTHSSIDDSQQICIWDFGGQYIYYAAHQLFHSRKSVYLLVLNLSWPLNKEVNDKDFPGPFNCKTLKEYIIFWMHSIHAFVGSDDGTEPVVILVGTHKDKLKNNEEAEIYFKSVRELFKNNELGRHIFLEAFALSLLDPDDTELHKLKRTIIHLGNRPEIQQEIPDKWICLEAKLSKLSSQNIVSLDDVLCINSQPSLRERRTCKTVSEILPRERSTFLFRRRGTGTCCCPETSVCH